MLSFALSPGNPVLAARGSRGGGTTGGSYTAQAVHFDGITSLEFADQTAALAADSPAGIMTVWVKGDNIFNSSGNTSFVIGRANDTFDIKNALSVQNGFGVDFAEGPDFNSFYAMNNNETPIPSEWTALLVAWDMNTAAGSRTFQCYYGDAGQSFTIESDYGDPFSCNYSDAAWVFFGSYADTSILADLADFQMWCGTGIDLSVQSNRRLFIDGSGKPVDPDVAALTLGTPTVLFSGDSSAFVSNQGTAGPVVALKHLVSGTIGAGGPGAIVLSGAVAGQTVHKVFLDGSPEDVTSEFEAVVSVDGEIQQSGSSDYQFHSITVDVLGTLTDATTSPSD